VARAYLAIGSNLGDRLAYLQLAVDALRETPGVHLVEFSAVYETGPVGGPEQGAYLNAVVAVDTDLEPFDLLRVGQAIEQQGQRVREVRWGPRTLDVDVLLYDDRHMDDPVLTIPHPRMYERAFVLVPLRDVAPEIAAEIPEDGSVVRYSEVLH
jgi:2-amino-4-hydroxy-6-hydroxymethyldihydropteridine diphosphokinase